MGQINAKTQKPKIWTSEFLNFQFLNYSHMGYMGASTTNSYTPTSPFRIKYLVPLRNFLAELNVWRSSKMVSGGPTNGAPAKP